MTDASTGRTELQNALRTAGDVIRAGNAGVGRGAIGLLGLPGDLRKFVDDKAIDLGERSGVLTERQAAAARANEAQSRRMTPTPFGGGYTSQEIARSLPAATQRGLAYRPATRAGQYSHTLGEFVPNALAPGGPALRGLSVAVPAAASEVAAQAARGTPWEGPARFAGALAGVGLTGALLRASGVPMQAVDPDLVRRIEFPPISPVDRTLNSIEDVFGQGRVRISTPEKFVGVSEDGSKQLRIDLGGHGFPPHFHLEQLETGRSPVGIFQHYHPLRP